MTDTDDDYSAYTKMTALELLTEVIANPEYLTDHYYSEFRDAILNRYHELEEEANHD